MKNQLDKRRILRWPRDLERGECGTKKVAALTLIRLFKET